MHVEERRTERPASDGRVLGEGGPGAHLDLQSGQEVPRGSQPTLGGRHPGDLGGRKVFPNLLPGHFTIGSRG